MQQPAGRVSNKCYDPAVQFGNQRLHVLHEIRLYPLPHPSMKIAA
jgi:hypothetical protein